MEKKRKKKKGRGAGALALALSLLTGAAVGLLTVKFLDSGAPVCVSPGKYMAAMLALLAVMYLSMFLQLVLHEAGHLVFGLLTGYGFCSFRVGSFMWIKTDEGLKMKKFSLAGTGGQCLLSPPALPPEEMPYVLYNLGGVIANLVFALLGLGAYFLLDKSGMAAWSFVIFSLIGFLYALTNGLPLHMGTVDNDGRNTLSMSKSPRALRAFWIQMMVNRLSMEGLRLKDMPEEWFAMPTDGEMKNSMCAVLGVLACGRLMDRGHFEEARSAMEGLLAADTAVVGLHRSQMANDCVFCELMGENRPEELERLMDKDWKKFTKSMKNYPSVLRTRYAHALLALGDVSVAEKIRTDFEKTAKSYPSAAETDGERELMDLAAAKAAEYKN